MIACLRRVVLTSIALALLLTPLTTVRSDATPRRGPCDQETQVSGGHSAVSNGCGGGSQSNSRRQSGSSGTNSATGDTRNAPHQLTYAEVVAKIKKQNEQAAEAYKIALAQANDHYSTGECAFAAGGSFTGQDCNPKKPKTIPIPKPPKGTPAPAIPPIPPEEAAYLAIATKLQINASGIGIGPDPALSRWKKAIVGHSYWLWATGPTHLGPVSDSASGRTVTLEANLTSVTFDMGDGNVVKCNGAGTPYPGDEKGLYAKSPTCGYAYQTTSEHNAGGIYTVRATAYWSVAYTAPDGSGTIPIVLASERDLRVGELQTVITH